MTKICMKSVLFFINFTLQFLRVYSVERVKIVPVEVVRTPGTVATFTCESSFLLMDLKWLFNGTQLEILNISDITTTFDSKLTGSLTWDSLLSKYNSTTIQCQAISLFFGKPITSERALLLVQGFLGTVNNFFVEFTGIYLNITWSPPFTLDVPENNPDISGYCIDIYSRKISCSAPTVLYSECEIYIHLFFELFIPLEYQCSEINTTILAVNFEGNGTKSTIQLGSCRRKQGVKALCSPAIAPSNGSLGLYSSTLMEEGTLVGYTCDPGYIPSPVAYHSICTNKGTWYPDPASVTCRLIPICGSISKGKAGNVVQSTFTRLNNPGVAEVVASVGVASFVGGGLVACIAVTLIAQKRWVKTLADSSNQEISNQKSPQSQEHPDYRESSSKSLIQKSTDQNSSQKSSDTVESTGQNLIPESTGQNSIPESTGQNSIPESTSQNTISEPSNQNSMQELSNQDSSSQEPSKRM